MFPGAGQSNFQISVNYCKVLGFEVRRDRRHQYFFFVKNYRLMFGRVNFLENKDFLIRDQNAPNFYICPRISSHACHGAACSCPK